jgi:hypothetical protein
MIARVWYGRIGNLLASEWKNSYNGGYLPMLIKYMKGIKI